MMIDHLKNAVFNNHPWKYGLPILRRMLHVLTEVLAATEWFGGFVEVDAWNARAMQQKDSTAGVAKKKLGSKGKAIVKPL